MEMYILKEVKTLNLIKIKLSVHNLLKHSKSLLKFDSLCLIRNNVNTKKKNSLSLKKKYIYNVQQIILYFLKRRKREIP